MQIAYMLFERYVKLRDMRIIRLAWTKAGKPSELATSEWARNASSTKPPNCPTTIVSRLRKSATADSHTTT